MKKLFGRAAALVIAMALLIACSGMSGALAGSGVVGEAAVADAPGAAGGARSGSVEYSRQEWQVLAIVNRNRMAEGLEPMTMFSGIQNACNVRVEELTGYFSHERPNGSMCFTALDEAGVPYTSAGENIAAGQTSPKEVMNAWMNSPGHRSNIMGGTRHIGVGYKYTGSSYRYFWVQMFVSSFNERTESIYLSGAEGLSVKRGAKIADMGIVLHEKNSVYGDCVCPLTDEMCAGYDPDKVGVQNVTVSFRGLTANFQVEVVAQSVESVSLNKTSADMKVGRTMQLTAQLKPENAPNRAVTWTTSDESVAKVDENGLVTAVGEGKATIKATAHSGASAGCRVTVTANRVKSIELDKKNVTITIKKDEMGKSIRLVATVKPRGASNKTLKWKSSDTSVATVDADGVVTSVGFGKCTITARATDGSGEKAKCTVNVVKKQVTSVKITGDTRMKKGATQQLIAAIKPVRAYDQRVKWKSSNTRLATVDKNGVVTALRKGTVTITCTARDGSREKGSIRIKIIK